MNINGETRTIETWMFREKNELFILVLTLLIVVTAGIALFNISFKVTLVALIFGYLYIKLQQAQLIGNALAVNEVQFPDIYKVFDEYKRRLQMQKVNLYIVQDAQPNAFTIGFPTASIILHSALVENFTKEELDFVIGHELGHVKASHNVILTFINPLGSGVFGASLLFSFWQRKAEYSADRCGLILQKKVEDAIASQLKLAVGLHLASKVNLSSYKQQLIGSENNIVKISEFLSDHPLTTNRVNRIINFWKENFKT